MRIREAHLTQHSVSIVIPSYNLGGYLLETLRSIEKARTAALREVVIVDDGSTDPETLQVLEQLKNSPYRVILQENRGLGAARNAAIRCATGEFILPVDSDNCIRRTYLSEAPDVLARNPSVGIVYGDAEYVGERSGRWHVPEFSFAKLVDGNFIDACALFRRRVWEDIGGYDERMPHLGWEDWDFWLRASVRGWRFVHLDEIAFDYRVRPGSMMSGVGNYTATMDQYLFSKKELAALGPLRPELRRLLNVEESLEYRLGTRLLRPVRLVMTKLYGHRKRATVDAVSEPLTSPNIQK
jgi:glycosyltransferase involved in cell wall biosynthesis